VTNLRTSPSGPAIVGQNQDDVLLWDVATRTWIPGPSPGGAVDSDQVVNVSGVQPAANVSEALDLLAAAIAGIPPGQPGLCYTGGALAGDANNQFLGPWEVTTTSNEDVGIVGIARDGRLRCAAARADAPNSIDLTFVVRINRVDTPFVVTLPALAERVSDTVQFVDVLAGDDLSVRIECASPVESYVHFSLCME